jgi:hypothetical protein
MVQSEIKNPKNSSENPFYKSKYAPLNEILNDIRPLLAKHKLCLIQDVDNIDNKIIVRTMLMHSSGEWMEQAGIAGTIDKPTGAAVGSMVTYCRRYALNAMLNISGESEDDDGQATEKNVISKEDMDKAYLKAKEEISNCIETKTLILIANKYSKHPFTTDQKTALHDLYNEKLNQLKKV